ncbi:unnamed protein product, partial [Prorocentrum cordatum]
SRAAQPLDEEDEVQPPKRANICHGDQSHSFSSTADHRRGDRSSNNAENGGGSSARSGEKLQRTTAASSSTTSNTAAATSSPKSSKHSQQHHSDHWGKAHKTSNTTPAAHSTKTSTT